MSFQIITCDNWWIGGAGGATCVDSLITWTGGDNYLFDGEPFVSSTGYEILPSTLYYVVLNSDSGAGTGSLAILDNLGNETNADYTVGAGLQEINITSPKTPQECYEGQLTHGDGHIDQLLRRITEIVTFEEVQLVGPPEDNVEYVVEDQ